MYEGSVQGEHSGVDSTPTTAWSRAVFAALTDAMLPIVTVTWSWYYSQNFHIAAEILYRSKDNLKLCFK